MSPVPLDVEDLKFWRGRRVLVTGHTGFKGSWLSAWLDTLGADVHGLALAPETAPSLYAQLDLERRVRSTIGDIRDRATVERVVGDCRPDVVLHLAAQSLVRRSYGDPLGTWSTNVMGTGNLLDVLRLAARPCAVVVVTTDKVYENREWEFAYRETDPLGGHDPYSASKAGTELITASYRKSFLAAGDIRVATARAGNVIGGGDWASDRIVPDLARAFAAGQALAVRNPAAVRPWQHVLDPLFGYMMLARRLAQSAEPLWQDAFNFGPVASDQRRVGDLVDAALRHWPGEVVMAREAGAPHEAGRLSLAIDRATTTLGWVPRWSFDRAVEATVTWYRSVAIGMSPKVLVEDQIKQFESSL